MRPLQDLYPDDFAHCYGCGRLNAHGLHVKSEWHEGESLARFQPEPHHMALPGYVYGGLTASLVDCHSMATAAAMVHGGDRSEAGYRPDATLRDRVTSYRLLAADPLGPVLVLRARATELTERKVVVETSVFADEVECARGRVVAVRMPATMGTASAVG